MERQVRIFVPDNQHFNGQNWGENLLGNIIAPIVSRHPELEWFWFSRYWGPSLSNNKDEDCIVTKVTDEWKRNDGNFYSFRFRYSLPEDLIPAFEKDLKNECLSFKCLITIFLPYNVISDLGSDRHVADPRTPERRKIRAYIVNNLYHSMAVMALDNLVQQGGNNFIMEDNDRVGFLNSRSSFRVPLHLFFNMTDMPLGIEFHLFCKGFRAFPRDYKLELYSGASGFTYRTGANWSNTPVNEIQNIGLIL